MGLWERKFPDMKKSIDLSTLTAAVHLIAVLSVLCFGTVFATAGVLTLPALCAAFTVGKDVFYHRFDVYDSLTTRYFSLLGEHMGMMKFFPLQLVFFLQLLGLYAAGKMKMSILIYVLTAGAAFILTLTVYLAACRVFMEEKPDIVRTAVVMFYRVQNMLAVWVAMILSVMLFGAALCGIMLIAGTVFLLAVEGAAAMAVLSFKKATVGLGPEDEDSLGEAVINKL
ncbi:MAG: hypothetical protein IJ555_09770 [Ruminococcus sp.]|nr:hypothetical protein [Ruminococcus sp.]